ncbi:unnamed protein product [Didymodactylos carnosus]|uniref:CH-like domain-containing protein n=3 Tax=Didymodactylos carnosus TaxID=1234261 RepID=A0A813RAA6_9BILA|nr:unnamed protein product [Didymodactylos carnosus]CAF3561001.1 unnamed protein product [Didymodactylos carnosus]
MELDDQLLQDLYAWLDQIPLSRPKKRIEKDFADGVMVAELIKYYFPSWVDLHNYAAASSTQQKLINWGLLNRILHQKSKTSEQANAMMTPRQNYTPPETDERSDANQTISQYARSGPPRPKPQGPGKKPTSMHNLSADVVSRIEFDEKEQECMAKDEQIQILQAKIRRLEHLLHLKDVRVEDLSEKLERVKGGVSRQPPTTTNGRK